MPSPETDRLAAEAMECLGGFPARPHLGEAEYPIQQFKAFSTATKRYAEVTRSDPLIHRSVAEELTGFPIFSKWSVSAFPTTFFGMPSAWSASCLADTTHSSRLPNDGRITYYMGASDELFTEVVCATRFRRRPALVSKQR